MTEESDMLDDKSKRKRNEQEDSKSASERRYQKLFDSSPMAYFYLSQYGIIQEVNNVAETLLGYDSKELLKRNISSIFPENGTSADAGRLLVSEVMQGKEIKDLEVQMVDADGARIWVSVTASLLKSPGLKESIGLMAVNIDRRKHAEARAIADRERSSLVLEVMTHDLNNVNQSLVFSLGLIEEMSNIPEAGRNLVRQTTHEVRKAARMISNLRAIINLGEKTYDLDWTDVHHTLSQAIELVGAELPWKKLTVNTNFKEGEIIIEGHSDLQTVFFNILLNSAQFDESDEVIVNVFGESTKGKDKVRISLEDSGSGVPNSLKEHIFRRSGAPETQIVGRGLGLTLVDRIIERLGGSVWVEDREENDHTKGARFVLLLQSWNEQKILECGRSTCITFYKSNHCLFCEPTYEIVTAVMDELGVPISVLEVVNVDDPNSNVTEDELPMLPTTRICGTEITGFADVDEVRTAMMNLFMKACYPF
ncbi:MAG: PAS domain S-box protein [Candidatus Thorarchaeota archaeon]|nr:PAS domain S-box protein [Candidatus Thorarchaeota archaeon]MCK5238249.1 PAS domain S-box protein [Candidatus Thorarchaeota archaeon]